MSKDSEPNRNQCVTDDSPKLRLRNLGGQPDKMRSSQYSFKRFFALRDSCAMQTFRLSKVLLWMSGNNDGCRTDTAFF